ncbi:U3 small nucleolar RNA-associated protein 14 homolog A [Diachasma alloeum]|uniref:U3 small nucleolar RNA-associated protein 14 homolog A n=1 Tax=Diachasma alloeum TaxID=454923 RepID=UPI0007381213|nr:U3 small nucleolar RNA-associated protein 14 homolog A [Diachasma alloeum]
MMSDLENDLESDHEVSKDHSKLLEEVAKLDRGQRVKKPSRSEPSLLVSEFHLVKSGVTDKDSVHLTDLLRTLQSNPTHRPITQKIKSLRTASKVLPKPLERPQAEKLKREIAFENTKKEIQKWDAIITRNRTAPKLSFPLAQGEVSLKGTSTSDFIKRFRVQSDLERELAALEPQQPEPEESKDDFPLTLGEILERRREAARFRAQQSYREAKAHRQNKIKSKKFHRIARKAKIKQQIKEFEELQKTDPEAALEKLEMLDRTRAEERMSLRHRSTGQWARNKQVRAKYDAESRKVLAQQLSISRELTQKVTKGESNESDEGEDEGVVIDGGDNPWINAVKSGEEIEEFVKGYKKYWDERNKRVEEEKVMRAQERGGSAGGGDEGVNIVPGDVPDALNPVEEVVGGGDLGENSKKSSRKETTSVIKSKTSEGEDEGVEIASADVSGVFNVEEGAGGGGDGPGEGSSRESRGKSRKRAKTLESGELGGNEEAFEVEEVEVNGRIVKVKKSRGTFTSQWTIETFPRLRPRAEESSLDLDDMFDKVEGKMKQRASKKMRRVKQKLRKLDKLADTEENEEEEGEGELPDLSFKSTRLRPELDGPLDETAGGQGAQVARNATTPPGEVGGGTKRGADIDPTKFISVKPKHLRTQIPEVMGDEGALDDSEDEAQHNIISEAFAEDDVVEEFRREKEDEIKKSQPEDLDLRLPGWGSWGGKNISQNLRKKRRFIMKFPKEAPRKDENKGDVIIVEDANIQIKRHLVAELPYPFTSVADYEASIRAPIGRDFVPENAHKRLTDPAVETRMGTIIEPMDEDVLVNKKRKITGLLPDRGDREGKRRVNKKNYKSGKKTGIKQKKIK